MLRKVVSAVVIAIVSIGLVVLPVLANTNYNLTTGVQDKDTIWNYDFCDDGYEGQADHMDQPVTIIYGGNANKTKVKDAYYYDGFQWLGSTMYNQLDDGAGWVNNDDEGRKTDPLDLYGWHFRVYATGGSHMHNVTWNDYVIVTTHLDWLANLGYGWSEDCENHLCALAQEKSGWSVYEDILNCQNRDWPGRWDGMQYWQCDGYGSKIILP
jgi:hypothetical protein